jgi:hypothetical protein
VVQRSRKELQRIKQGALALGGDTVTPQHWEGNVRSAHQKGSGDLAFSNRKKWAK